MVKKLPWPVTLGGPPDKVPMEAAGIDVNITKRADSTELQHAIWMGMLGNGNPSQEVTDK